MPAGDINDMKKQAEAYAKAISASEKSASEMQKVFGQITSSLLDLSVNDFFKEIERSPELMRELEAEVKKLTDELKNSGDEINKIFTSAFKNTKGGTALDKLEAQTQKLKTQFPEAAKLIQAELETIKASATLTIKDLDFASVLAKAPQEAAEFSKALLGSKVAAGKLNAEINSVVLNSLKLAEVEKDLSRTTKDVFDPKQGLEKFLQRNFSLSLIIKQILDYDQQISKAQRETGILFKDNTTQMSKLAIQGARFGLSTADMANFMGQVGDTLNTTDFGILAKAADDTKAIAMATGLAYTDVAKLTAQFMSLGKSSEDVSDFVQQTAKDAKTFGLNTNKVLSDINRNFTKFKTYGFAGGEKSLAKMVETAQRLRINVDDVFNVAEKTRTIEGAMEAAADLQLAGGAASNIDPMQLLAAARKGGEGLTKILAGMTSDIGKFNKETGEIEFDPIDHDRMDMIAKATGMSMDSIVATTVKGKQRIQKESSGLFDGFGSGLDEKTKNIIDQFSTIGKGGQIKLTGAFDGKSIDELKSMSQKDIQARIADYQHTQDTNEDAAKKNMAFNESLTNLKNSFMNVFTLLEPAIITLTKILNWFNSMPTLFKEITAAIVAGFMISRKLGMFSGAAGGGGGLFGKMGSMFGGGTKAAEDAAKGAGNVANGAAPAGNIKGGENIKNTLTGIAEGIKAFASPKVLLGALAMITAAIGLTLMTATLPFLIGIALIGEAAGIGLAAFGEGLAVFGEAMSAAAPEILIGELLLAGFGAALIPLTYALSLLSPLIDSFGKIIIGVFSAIPPIITALADGFVTVAKGMGDMAVNLIPLAPGLFILGPALISAALGFTAFFMSFLNPFAIMGMGIMVMSLGSLNNIMSTLAPNLDMGAKSINAMADGVKNLSTALSTINTDALDKVKSLSEVSALNNAVNAIVGATSGGGNNAVQKFEITVVVQNENGRELQRRIINDTGLIK